ncbi:DUF2946 domain-containing protein [Hydrogenophaga sp. PAMC20947]|nr:DUF2946 domain-containing protein [Hydrogenophaga sp. PAMC20947]
MRWMSPSLLRSLARCLLGAMLLATLAPAVSRTLTASRQAGDWVEICTTQGMRWAQLSGGDTHLDSGLKEGLLHALDRCGHCALTAERFAPLVSGVPAIEALAAAWPRPHHTEASQRSHAALTPSARGPPCA